VDSLKALSQAKVSGKWAFCDSPISGGARALTLQSDSNPPAVHTQIQSFGVDHNGWTP
jgi:hypothetical protein